MLGDDTTTNATAAIIVALGVAIPGIIAAFASIRNGHKAKDVQAKLTTSNGKEIGEITEDVKREVSNLAYIVLAEQQKAEVSRQLLRDQVVATRDHAEADARFQAMQEAFNQRIINLIPEAELLAHIDPTITPTIPIPIGEDQ